MPNQVKNSLTIYTDVDTIKQITNMFGTLHQSKQRIDFSGNLVYKNKDDNYGWFNPTKNEFTLRGDGTIYNHVLEGYEPDFDDEWFQFPDFEKVIAPPDDPAYRDEPSQEQARTSPNWWCEWNIQHWGTKWNSYNCEQIDKYTFAWDTAWSNVLNIVKDISRKFKDVVFEYAYADEDTGYNCGRYTIKGGDVITEILPEGASKEAYELAFELREDYRDNYELVDGNYRHKEELDDAE